MAKAEGSPHNTGRLNAYSYHVFDNHDVKGGRKRRFILADSWYPVPAQEQELVILHKIYDLCEGIDGNPYYIRSYDNLSRLFLTSDYIMRDGRFFKNEYVEYRTEERYKNFVREGYLVDEPTGQLSITFSGIKRMEAALTAETKDDILDQVCNLNKHVLALLDSQDRQNDVLLQLRNSWSDYIAMVDKNSRFTVLDGLGVASDLTTTIDNIPAVFSVGKTVIAKLPAVISIIRAILASIG